MRDRPSDYDTAFSCRGRNMQSARTSSPFLDAFLEYPGCLQYEGCSILWASIGFIGVDPGKDWSVQIADPIQTDMANKIVGNASPKGYN